MQLSRCDFGDCVALFQR